MALSDQGTKMSLLRLEGPKMDSLHFGLSCGLYSHQDGLPVLAGTTTDAIKTGGAQNGFLVKMAQKWLKGPCTTFPNMACSVNLEKRKKGNDKTTSDSRSPCA